MIIIKFIQWLTEILPGPIESLTLLLQSLERAFNTARTIISFIGYVLPLDAIINCVRISLALVAARVAIAIWKLLPLT